MSDHGQTQQAAVAKKEWPNNASQQPEPPNIVFRILQLTWTRVTETRESRIYALTILVSTIVGIVLEAFIAVAHTDALGDVRHSESTSGEVVSPNSALSHADANTYGYVLLSLQRLKDENVFFVLFHVFQLYLGFDAIVRQSMIQLTAHAANEFICMVLALVQMGETLKWNSIVSTVDDKTGEHTSHSQFYTALRYEIGMAATMAFLTCVFAYLCTKLLRQIGWNVYRRLGADPKLQARFRLCQIFLLSLKLDGFFQLVFSIFWFVVMTQEGYQYGTRAAVAWYVLHLFLTLVQFPAPFLARYGLSTEQPRYMIAFLVIHVFIIVDFIIILQQSSSIWVFWVLAVCLAIVLSIWTIVITILVTRNFGKGLKPYVQRLFDRNYRYKLDPGANPTFSEHGHRQSSWLIDEDIEEEGDMGTQQPSQPHQQQQSSLVQKPATNTTA
ncbi:hypothetical protein BCR43DRAFT_525553 [Syncephalastrum racemosum]|uniref:Uncharacterized protein n=1 Tax=Syncephalastrum racemosum TaxID=13706 RepID=A0A1X2HB95_SYNRA|nr:hypothetical protein BCR43DRAFT_525553 [Syncephalastrum racemosum]